MNKHAEAIRTAVANNMPFKAQISRETHTQLFDWYHINREREHITFKGGYTGRIYYDGVSDTIAISSARRDQYPGSRNDHYDNLVYVEIVDSENSLNAAAIATESQQMIESSHIELETRTRQYQLGAAMSEQQKTLVTNTTLANKIKDYEDELARTLAVSIHCKHAHEPAAAFMVDKCLELQIERICNMGYYVKFEFCTNVLDTIINVRSPSDTGIHVRSANDYTTFKKFIMDHAASCVGISCLLNDCPSGQIPLNSQQANNNDESNMKRTITAKEIDLRNMALRCRIKLDFLTKKVSYVKATELPFLVNECRQTDAVRKQIRQALRTEFDAVYVSVGNGNIAIVKRVKSN